MNDDALRLIAEMKQVTDEAIKAELIGRKLDQAVVEEKYRIAFSSFGVAHSVYFLTPSQLGISSDTPHRAAADIITPLLTFSRATWLWYSCEAIISNAAWMISPLRAP